LTTLLLPALKAGARSSPDGHARIVNTSSGVVDTGADINFNTFRDGPQRKKLGQWGLYGQSKLVSLCPQTCTWTMLMMISW
jgi:retinol dehydrogenase-12